MLRLNICCFCNSLETGSKIFGWVNLIGSIISLIFYGAVFIMFISGGDEGKTSNLDAAQAFFWVILLIVSIAFSLILLKGISERNPTKISYYKIFTIIFVVLFTIDAIYTILSGAFSQSTEKPHLGQEIATSMITILITIYEIVIIYSLEMMIREESPLPLTQPSHQMYPPQQPILVTQPYPPQDYKNSTNPPSYTANDSLTGKS